MPEFDFLLNDSISTPSRQGASKPSAGEFDFLLSNDMVDVSPEQYAQRSQAAGVSVGRSAEEQKKILQQRGFSPQATEQLRQQYELANAREQERQKGFGAKDTWTTAKHMGLGFADLFDASGTTDYGRAMKRFQAGTPEAGDAEKIAKYEQYQKNTSSPTVFGSRDAGDIASQLLHIPKIAQEAMIGGAVLKAAGIGAGLSAEASLAQRAGSALAAAPAQLVVMPSLWREQARQKNLENGLDPADIQGYGPALINGLANVIVLNRLQSGVKSQTLGGAMKKGALFVGEQALVDLGLTDADALVKGVNEDFGKRFKMSTGYGTIENLLTGKYGEAMKQATGQFLLGATFAGLHSAGAFGEAMDAAKKELDASKVKGLTPDEAGQKISDQHKAFTDAVTANPDLTRAEAAQAVADATGQKPGPFVESVASHLPETSASDRAAMPTDPRARRDHLTDLRNKSDERVQAAERSEKSTGERAGLLNASPKAVAEHQAAKTELRNANTERKAIQRRLDATRDEIMRTPSEATGVAPAKGTAPPAETPAGGEIVQPAASGEAIGPVEAAKASEKPTEVEMTPMERLNAMRGETGLGEPLATKNKVPVGPVDVQQAKPDTEGWSRHELTDSTGNAIGHTRVKMEGNTVRVDWSGIEGFGAAEKGAANLLGGEGMSRMMRQLAEQYPEAQQATWVSTRQLGKRYVKDLAQYRDTPAELSAESLLADKIAGNAANPPNAGAQAQPGSPGGMGFTPDVADSATLKHLKESATRWVQNVKDFFGRLAGQTAPKTNRLSEISADGVARVAASRHYARALAPHVLDNILTDPAHNDAAARDIVGAVMVEESLRYAREQHLGNGNAEKAVGVGTIIGSGRTVGEREANPLKTEADYQRLRAEPWVQDVIKRYEKEYVPLKEQYFRKSQGMDEAAEIDALTQIPGRPIYRMNLPEGEVRSNSGEAEPVGRSGMSRGDITAQRARKLSQSREAKGTGHYEIDLGKIIEGDLLSLVSNSAKADLYRTLVKEGLGKWAKPGEGPDIYTRIPDVRPPRGTQEAQKGEIDLYVHPEVYQEVRQVLGNDLPPSPLPFAIGLMKATLASTVEFAYHLRNLMSLLTRPGMNPVEFIRNVRKIIQGDREVMQRITDLTELGAMKEHGYESATLEEGYAGGKLNPVNWVAKGMEFSSKMITVADRAMRLTADHAFDVISKRPGVDKSEGARRDFINQLGNYNKLTQNKFIAQMRDLGLGPFATAGSNFWMQGLRGLTLSHGLRTSTREADLKLRGEMLLRMAVLPAIAAGLNMVIWGRPDGDEKTPIAGLKIGESNGKTSYLDLGGLVGLTRGMRETGLLALAEQQREGAQRKKATLGDATDRAFSDITTAMLHPLAGPPVAFAHTAITGENMLGSNVAPRANLKKGESQAMLNAYAALFQTNPILESWLRPLISEEAGIKEKKKEPTTEEKAFKMLGPFGVKTRGTEPGAPRREMTIPITPPGQPKK